MMIADSKDKTLKVSITTPARERSLNDEAARRHQMNRSEFYTNAAALYRQHLDRADELAVAEIDALLDRFGQPDADVIRTHANRVLVEVEW